MPTLAEVLHTSNNQTSAQTLTTSAGTAVGDTIIVIYGSDYYTLADMGTPTSTAGTPSLVGTSDAGDLYVHLKVYKIDVGVSGAQDVVIPAAINCDIHGVVLRYVGEVDVDAFAAGQWNGTTSTAAAVAPSVNASAVGETLICGWIQKSGDFPNTYSIPGGMTRRADTDANPFSAMCVATEDLASAGATGTRTATWPSLTQWCSVSILVADVGGEEHAGSTALGAGASIRPAGAKGGTGTTVQPAGSSIVTAGKKTGAGQPAAAAGAAITTAGSKTGLGHPQAAAGLSAASAGSKGAAGVSALQAGAMLRAVGAKHASGTTRMSAGARIRPQTPDDTPPRLDALGGQLLEAGVLGGELVSSGLGGSLLT